MAKFVPKEKSKTTLVELLALAEITEDDLKIAIEDWKENAPSEFTNLIEAEVRNES